jgi:hypothetical protein
LLELYRIDLFNRSGDLPGLDVAAFGWPFGASAQQGESYQKCEKCFHGLRKLILSKDGEFAFLFR